MMQEHKIHIQIRTQTLGRAFYSAGLLQQVTIILERLVAVCTEGSVWVTKLADHKSREAKV